MIRLGTDPRVDGEEQGQAAVIATLGSELIHARTEKIKMVALSSTESETISMPEGTTHAQWLKAMLIGFGYAVDPRRCRTATRA